MLLLDRLVSVSDRQAVSEVDVMPGATFACDRGVASWVGIEYMAQTVAAIAGWRARHRHEPIRAGYLLGTRRYAPAVSYFRLHSTVRIIADEEWMEPDGMARFHCAIKDGETVLVEASLACYQPADAPVVKT